MKRGMTGLRRWFGPLLGRLIRGLAARLAFTCMHHADARRGCCAGIAIGLAVTATDRAVFPGAHLGPRRARSHLVRCAALGGRRVGTVSRAARFAFAHDAGHAATGFTQPHNAPIIVRSAIDGGIVDRRCTAGAQDHQAQNHKENTHVSPLDRRLTPACPSSLNGASGRLASSAYPRNTATSTLPGGS